MLSGESSCQQLRASVSPPFWQGAAVSSMDWIVSVLVVVALALAARWARALALERGWRRPLRAVPHELAQLWGYQDPRAGRDSRGDSDEQPPDLSALDVLFHLSRLDRRQLARFHPKTPPEDFEELLGRFVAPADGSAGHGPGTGEQLLAQQLSYQRHDVLLDPPSVHSEKELPGWCARVDGLPVRIVASLDPGVVQEHLDGAPAIPIVTVAEHAQHFAGQGRVVALPEVSHAQISRAPTSGAARQPLDEPAITELAESASSEPDTALGRWSGIGSMLASQAASPALMTALRTAQLIAKGDTSWLSTASDGLVDSAASSAGGWAGARAGAMLGALLGPVGAAAGGFLGARLGQQLAEGMTAGTREKRLRQMLAEQDALLARVPQVAADALAAQALHLQSVSLEMTAGAPRFELWPSAAIVAREQLAAEYRRWQQRVARRSRRLNVWLKTQPTSAKRSARGAELLSEGRLGWSVALLELRAHLMQLATQLKAERRRLGG
jgi:hypothetical protein